MPIKKGNFPPENFPGGRCAGRLWRSAVRGAGIGTVMKVDLWKNAGSLEDLSEKEKGLLCAVFLFPFLIAALLFILAPFFT